MKTKLLPLLGVLALLFTTTVNAAYYLFSDLGSHYTYTFISPAGINNAGDIVGSAYDNAGRPVAFRRNSAGAFQIYPSPGPAHSAWGNGINNTGTIVGFCDRNGGVYHALYAPTTGPAVDFDSNFTRNSEAVAINDSGYVVGTASSQAFLGHTGGWIYLLGSTLGTNFVAKDINNDFVIAGYDPTWGGRTYDVGSSTTTYLGWAVGSFNNRACAINESGEVAGTVSGQGFLYSSGVAKKFGSSVTEVKALNAGGDIVGTANDRAFVYLRRTDEFIDLNTAISGSTAATWTLVSATGINDSGVICGMARRLATPADGPGAGTYIYRGYKLRPFTIFLPPFPPVMIR